MAIIDIHGRKKSVSIVIPTLNEVSNIQYVFSNLPDFIDEIVVVDGQSKDGTIDEIRRIRSDARIIVDEPKGKGAALKTGFNNVTGDLIIMMDADGSHNPKEITQFMKPILNGYDVSKGSRMIKGGGSSDITPFRRLGNKIFVTMVNSMYGSDYTDLCYGYRAFKKEAYEKIDCDADGFEVETQQSIRIKKAGLRVKEVPSFEALRKNGNSNLNSFKDGWRILNIIVKEYFN